MQAYERIICALDVDSVERAAALVRELHGRVGVFKVGLELLTAVGPTIFAALREAGAERFFYDGKLHDIPNTVAGAMRGVMASGAWCVTVHAAGGGAMLRAATAAAKQSERPPKVLAVTLLTSVGADVLEGELGVNMPVGEYVAKLARLAYESGCDGVIASPHEIAIVRAAVPEPKFLIITPGVRPAGAAPGDQARAMTPGEAIRQGADYLVIGRPITGAESPGTAAAQIALEMEQAAKV